MTTNYKILGQSKPAANTETTLYTVPAATSAIVRSIIVANTTASSDTYTIAILPVVASATTNANYIAYTVSLAANTTATIKAAYTIPAAGGIKVTSISGNSTFTAFGAEVS